jgi:hypothetical protein
VVDPTTWTPQPTDGAGCHGRQHEQNPERLHPRPCREIRWLTVWRTPRSARWGEVRGLGMLVTFTGGRDDMSVDVTTGDMTR